MLWVMQRRLMIALLALAQILQWAREKRTELLCLLGAQCNICNAAKNLVFDCIIPCGDYHHRLDTSARMSFYRKQHKEKNLQVLCKKCNDKKSAQDANHSPF
jgi:hypothetical protein